MFPNKKKKEEQPPKRELGAFANYPTAHLLLDKDLKPYHSEVAEADLIKQRVRYILAKAHYRTTTNEAGEEERAYDLEYSHIAEMLFMVPDDKYADYPPMITRIVRYGEEPDEPKLVKRW